MSLKILTFQHTIILQILEHHVFVALITAIQYLILPLLYLANAQLVAIPSTSFIKRLQRQRILLKTWRKK